MKVIQRCHFKRCCCHRHHHHHHHKFVSSIATFRRMTKQVAAAQKSFDVILSLFNFIHLIPLKSLKWNDFSIRERAHTHINNCFVIYSTNCVTQSHCFVALFACKWEFCDIFGSKWTFYYKINSLISTLVITPSSCCDDVKNKIATFASPVACGRGSTVEQNKEKEEKTW